MATPTPATSASIATQNPATASGAIWCSIWTGVWFNATGKSKGVEYAIGGVSYYMNEEGIGNQKIKSNLFVRKLVQVPQYREKFLKRYAELFNSVLTTENMVSLFYEMTAQIKPEMQMHSERWATEMSPKVSFDVPKNATGAYNYCSPVASAPCAS